MEFQPEEHNCHLLVYRHVAMKGAQAGSVLGAASVAPSMALAAYKSVEQAMTARQAVELAAKRSSVGLTYGLAAMSVVGAVRLVNVDTEGAQDRAYRLHYNENQNRCDKFWLLSSIAGGLAGFASGGPAKVFGTAALGGVFGILAHVILPSASSE